MTDDDAGRPPGGPRDPAPPGVSPIRLWLPPAVYCILIFIQSAGPAPDGLPKFCYSDKLMHFLGYAVLGFLFCRAFSGAWPDRAAGSAIFAGAVATFVYGVTDEWHQAFVAERSADVLDAGADGLGGLAGAFIYATCQKRRMTAHTEATAALTKQGTSGKEAFGALSATDRNPSKR